MSTRMLSADTCVTQVPPSNATPDTNLIKKHVNGTSSTASPLASAAQNTKKLFSTRLGVLTPHRHTMGHRKSNTVGFFRYESTPTSDGGRAEAFRDQLTSNIADAARTEENGRRRHSRHKSVQVLRSSDSVLPGGGMAPTALFPSPVGTREPVTALPPVGDEGTFRPSSSSAESSAVKSPIRGWDPVSVMASIKRSLSMKHRRNILARRPSLEQKIEAQPSLMERLKIFEAARFKRGLKEGGIRAVGVVNTFAYLAGVRGDVEFCKRAVAEKKRLDAVNKGWDIEQGSAAANSAGPGVVTLKLTESTESTDSDREEEDNATLAQRKRNSVVDQALGARSMSWTRDNSKSFHTPYFTYTMILVTLVLLLVSIGMNGWAIEPFHTNPMLGPTSEVLVDLGALDTVLIVQYNQPWRLLTPWFLHAGIIHYLLNTLSFAVLGRMLERAHGTLKVVVIFFSAAMCGSVSSALFLQTSVGASGGVFGLVGGVLVDIIKNRKVLFDRSVVPSAPGSKCGSYTVLAVEIFFLLIVGLTPFVDNYAHLGGLVGGVFTSMAAIEKIDYEGFFGKEKEGGDRRCGCKKPPPRSRFFFLLVPLVFVGAGIPLLFSLNAKTVCDLAWCEALTCVEFPPNNPWWSCEDQGKEVLCVNRAKGTSTSNESGIYEVLDMTCPDGSKYEVNLQEDEKTTDIALLEDDLVSYCIALC